MVGGPTVSWLPGLRDAGEYRLFMDALDCPRCHAAMVERPLGEATIRQCPDGHGIFLERRDLSDLIDAETAFHRDGGGLNTAPLPRITADMTAPPRSAPRAPAWVATLFG